MLYDLRVTPEQLRAAAAWCYHDGGAADVELRVDDRMLIAEQGDDVAAWDTGGEPGSTEYVTHVRPLLNRPGTRGSLL